MSFSREKIEKRRAAFKFQSERTALLEIQKKKKRERAAREKERELSGRGRTSAKSLSPTEIETSMLWFRGEIIDLEMLKVFGSHRKCALAFRDLVRDGYVFTRVTEQLQELVAHKLENLESF